MKRRAIIRAAALGLAATVLAAASPPRANWTATVTVADDGTHVLGNPKAKVQLTEFVSYTCPHCATFQKEADAPLRLLYVRPGTVSVKVHTFVRDPVDLAVAMLVNCGDTAGFFKRHHAFLHGQDRWLSRMGAMSSAQRQRWYDGEMGPRLQSVAQDFGFYAMMEQHGVSRIAANRCLADRGLAQKLVAQTEQARALGVNGTPSFALDGTVLAGTHDWKTLDPQIKARVQTSAR